MNLMRRIRKKMTPFNWAVLIIGSGNIIMLLITVTAMYYGYLKKSWTFLSMPDLIAFGIVVLMGWYGVFVVVRHGIREARAKVRLSNKGR